MFGYLPPPYFGPTVTYQALLHSSFSQHYDVTFINQRFSRTISELQQFNLHKVLETIRLLVLECWYLLSGHFDICYISISLNRKAFLKEACFIRLAGLFGVRSVLFTHGYGLVDFYNHSSPCLRRQIDEIVSNAAAAIVLGEKLRGEFSRWLPPEKIFVVGTGIEPSAFKVESVKSDQRFMVLFLGNLIREKGVFVLLEAVPKIIAAIPQARFIFAGAWPNEQDRLAAGRLLRETALEDHVRFAGVVWGEKKRELLASADVFAFPTFYPLETFGLVLLEALEAGLPVVTTPRARSTT